MPFLFERKAGRNYTVTGAQTLPRALGTREGCLALLNERANALADVVCAKKLMLDLRLELELRVQVAVEHSVERPLRARVRPRRPARQPPSQLERLLRQRLGLEDAVDQAPVERLLG